jgi:hypothetical protein
VGKANGNLIERAVPSLSWPVDALYAAVHYHVGWPARKEEVKQALQLAEMEY